MVTATKFSFIVVPQRHEVYRTKGVFDDLISVSLKKLGIPESRAYMWGNTRLGYWRIAGTAVLTRSITKERLAQAGYFDISSKYESLCLKG